MQTGALPETWPFRVLVAWKRDPGWEAYNDLAGALIATVPLPINRIAMKLTTAGFIPRLFTLD
jgi:hypothetical protein